MCRTIHKIALITNLTQSLGGVEFKIDSVNNKGQYSIDGGTTWQNFSSGVAINPNKTQDSNFMWSVVMNARTSHDRYKSIMPLGFTQISIFPSSSSNNYFIDYRFKLNDGTYTQTQECTNYAWNDITPPSNAVLMEYWAYSVTSSAIDLYDFYFSCN